MTTDHPIFGLADRFVDGSAALCTMTATCLGVSGQEHRWGDLGPDGVAAEAAFLQQTRAELDTLPDARNADERLETVYLPASPPTDAVGPDRYRRALRGLLGTDPSEAAPSPERFREPMQERQARALGAYEGWALYTETLMNELGFLERPAYELGYPTSSLLRVLRVVIDLGWPGQAISSATGHREILRLRELVL